MGCGRPIARSPFDGCRRGTGPGAVGESRPVRPGAAARAGDLYPIISYHGPEPEKPFFPSPAPPAAPSRQESWLGFTGDGVGTRSGQPHRVGWTKLRWPENFPFPARNTARPAQVNFLVARAASLRPAGRRVREAADPLRRRMMPRPAPSARSSLRPAQKPRLQRSPQNVEWSQVDTSGSPGAECAALKKGIRTVGRFDQRAAGSDPRPVLIAGESGGKLAVCAVD